MTPLDLRAAIQDEAMTWLRTPYHHAADLKGQGVDCLMLLVRVFAAVGCIPAGFDPRPYSHQWHLHRSEEAYLQGLGRFMRPLPQGAQPGVGDVGLWRFGRTYSHAGLLVQAVAGGPLEVVHALAAAGEVTLHRLDAAPLAGRPALFFTLFPELS